MIQALRPDGDFLVGNYTHPTAPPLTASLFGDETGTAISARWFYRIDEVRLECAKCGDDQQVIHRKWRNDPND